MNSTIHGVEPFGDQIKERRIALLIPSKHGVGNLVGKLHRPRGTGIDEERRVDDVAEDAPACSQLPKVAGKSLQARFVGTLVEDDQPPLWISFVEHPHEPKVEAVAKFLESQFHRIRLRKRSLVNRNGEETSRWM